MIKVTQQEISTEGSALEVLTELAYAIHVIGNTIAKEGEMEYNKVLNDLVMGASQGEFCITPYHAEHDNVDRPDKHNISGGMNRPSRDQLAD